MCGCKNKPAKKLLKNSKPPKEEKQSYTNKQLLDKKIEPKLNK